MKYATVCSGIEAPSVAWHSLGWEPVFFSEIEKFPSAVLNHHYPGTENLGDMTKIRGKDYAGSVDVFCGGTPCQSFSVAGLRKGLADPRGNLALVFLALVDAIRPKWVVWENVPGVLSSEQGRDFGSFVGGLGKLGYGWAYRVLDAQYFGVPQKRRRVFVVGYIGGWQGAAAVLFERESMRRDSPPSRETGAVVAALTARGVGTCGADDNQGQAGHFIAAPYGLPLLAKGNDSHDDSNQAYIAECVTGDRTHALTAEGFDASEDGTGRGTPICFDSRQDPSVYGNLAGPCGASLPVGAAVAFTPGNLARGAGPGPGPTTGTLRGARGQSDQDPHVAYAFQPRIGRNGRGDMGDRVNALTSQAGETGKGDAAPCVATASIVRRLTPRECERLQGFPDDHTRIPWRGRAAKDCPDGPRYKAIGNSMAVPVMRWIGERIETVDNIIKGKA